MAAARHEGRRGYDVARGRERDSERSRGSQEHRRGSSRDRDSDRRLSRDRYSDRRPSRDGDSGSRRDGGRSRGREVSDGYSRHRSPHQLPRSRPSGRVEDREPGEVSSGSGSESCGRPLKATGPREDGDVGVCRSDRARSPSMKRKCSPVIWDIVSKMQASDVVRSRREVDATAAELPQSSPLPLSDGSTVVMVSECSPMNLDVSADSHNAEQLQKHEHNGIMEGEEEGPAMRNIFTSRWADADEEEVVLPQKKRSVSPAKSSRPELGEALEGKTSKGTTSSSSNSMVVQGNENCELEVDRVDLALYNEDDIDSSAGFLLHTDFESDMRRSKTPDSAQPPRRCINMLQSCRTIDDFEKLNAINEGTYGVVLRARDKKTGEVVAVKKVKMDKEREGFPLTSLREINILLSLHHPSIVDVKEVVVGGRGNDTFMVMEYMEHDLKGVMETMKQPYTQSEVKCLMLQLLEGVKYLHDNWVLHRDLKTSNLLLNNRGELKICDFGLSRQYGSPLKPYTQPVVTLWYRAPELLLGATEYSTAIDMWSLGCIMAELILKQPLFKGESEIDQLKKIFEMLGTPNEETWPGYSELPGARVISVKRTHSRLRGKFPAVSFTGGLTLSEAGFDLLSRLLTYDPEKRISADAALNHEWFREVPLPKTKDFMPTFPALNEQDRRIKKYVRSPDPLEELQKKEQESIGDRGLFG
ncbi:hypothetical protein ACP70R_027363 [Stipagrostis hirtigluma subsp. patula]